MESYFDITKFGAVGDGKTDCTAAIQSAIDAASECCGTVFIPAGIFMTGKLVAKGHGISIIGHSGRYHKIDIASSLLMLNDSNADCLLDISGAVGCNISGVRFKGNNLGENTHGIKIYWDKYNGNGVEDCPTIDGCSVMNFSGDGLHFEHVWCFELRNSQIGKNKGAGLYMDGWDAYITNNWFGQNGAGGFVSGKAACSVTFTANRVEWNKKGGIIVKDGNSYNITGNFFDRTFGNAILLGDDEKGYIDTFTITGNIFRRSGAYAKDIGKQFENEYMSSHIRLIKGTNVVITGNAMRVGQDDGASGSFTPDYSVVVYGCRDCIVKLNTMGGGSLKKNVVEFDNENCIIDENVGDIEKGK